jgi:hypothetical protein
MIDDPSTSAHDEVVSNKDSLLRQFADCEHEIRDLKERLAILQATRARLEAVLLDQWEESGVQRTTVDGLTIYIRRDLWAKCENADVLAGTELDHSITTKADTHKLSAAVREIIRAYASMEGMHPTEILRQHFGDEVAAAITITENYQLRSLKAQ